MHSFIIQSLVIADAKPVLMIFGSTHTGGRGKVQSASPVTMSYVFHPAAEAEHLEPVGYFESNSINKRIVNQQSFDLLSVL